MNALLCTTFVCALIAGASAFPYNPITWWPNPDGPPGALIPVHLPIGVHSLRDVPTPSSTTAADPDKIRFYLFTPNSPNPEEGEELFVDDLDSVLRSSFMKGAPVKTFAHGFSSGIRTGYPWDVRGAYLDWGQDMNLILVDWKALAIPPNYVGAALNTKLVGQKSAALLAFLHRAGYVDPATLHVQGISLGAHVAGVTGSTFTGLTGLKAARISAYDPAMPLFIDADDEDRIDPTDAEFVDVVHTAGGTLGMVQRRGTVDFYPNGGKVQPGCALDLTGTCSHFRASQLCIESIAKGGIPFNACRCTDWAEFDKGNCECTETAVMGEYTSTTTADGAYYLRTNKNKPFALG